jgi:hypothetical protein
MRATPAGAVDVLIIFPNDWAAYSPTLLNLVRMLSEEVSVRVVALRSRFDVSALDETRFVFAPLRPSLIKLLGRLGLQRIAALVLIMWRARSENPGVIIGVDSAGGLVAQWLWRKPYFFVSLEVERGLLFRLIRLRRIAAMAIQTRERLEYLFGGTPPEIRTVLVHNAPILTSPAAAKPAPPGTARCVFLGSALPEHAIMESIRALRAGGQWSLTVKGMMPPEVHDAVRLEFADLMEAGRLVLDAGYVEQRDIVDYLSRFDIGLCLYNFQHIARDDFNYLSCPSGKLFNYFGAGLPVVGTDMLGLRPVSENDAGVLVKGLAPSTIDAAVQAVMSDYDRFSKGSARAAARYDFRLSAAPFIQQIVAAARSG